MRRENSKTKKGFTIIEVVLVLAIAGLIFLMVFVALPALQRSQRDTQRRDDMARFLAQLNQYQANNNGRVPHENAPEGTDITEKYNNGETGFIAKYLLAGNDTFADPSSHEVYKVTSFERCSSDGGDNCNGTTPGEVTESSALGNISVYSNARCDGEDVKYVQGDRKIAIRLNLEGAGIYCGNN